MSVRLRGGGGRGGYLNMFEDTNYRYHLRKHAELWVSLLAFTVEIYVILRFWVKDMQKLFDDYFVL